jgi:DNA-binding beta-propeller fold protein YncE
MPRKQSRRDFSKLIGLGTTAPLVLLGNTAPTLGVETHRYEWDGAFFKVPKNWKWGYTHGVAVDKDGRTIIHHTGPNPVAIFDPTGKLMYSWGPEFEKGAHGLTLFKNGKEEQLIFCDTNRCVVETFDLNGTRLLQLPHPKLEGAYDEKRIYKPTNAAVTKDGTIYVADGYGQGFVHIYNKKGEYVKSFGGGKSAEAGKLNGPHGIWIDSRSGKELVLVADRSNSRLAYFNLDGTHHSHVADELRRPCQFDVFGTDLLIPDLNGRVTIFNKENKLVAHLGDQPEIWKTKGWPNLDPATLQEGKFNSPHSACYDKKGNIIVVEWISYGRVTKLRRVA